MGTRINDVWHCDKCGAEQGRHDMWFEGVCESCFNEADLYDIEDNTLNVGDKVYLVNIDNLRTVIECFDVRINDLYVITGGYEDNIAQVRSINTGKEHAFFADRFRKVKD